MVALGLKIAQFATTSRLQRRVHGSRNRPKRVLLFEVSKTWSRSLLPLTDRCRILQHVYAGPAYISGDTSREKARYSVRDKLATNPFICVLQGVYYLLLEVYTARVWMVGPGEPLLSTLFRLSLHLEFRALGLTIFGRINLYVETRPTSKWIRPIAPQCISSHTLVNLQRRACL
jgi:hypothetical protein